MTDRGLTLQKLAEALGGTFEGDADCSITDVAALQEATTGDISFLANAKYRKQLATTQASAVILHGNEADACPVNKIILNNPYLGFARAAQLLHPQSRPSAGIHPSAVVAPDCTVHPTASIGPNVCLETGVDIGANVIIGANCSIGKQSRIGEDSRLWSNVAVYHDVVIGARCILHSGAVIGSDGFGFAPDEQGRFEKIPQLRGVILGNDVEVGASSTIDRGALIPTRIGNGVKLDNQVQVGHNVQMGDHCAIAGATTIGGSAQIGNHVMMGGCCAVNGHITIVDGVHIAARGMVTNSVLEKGSYSSGVGLQKTALWRRNVARFHHLDEMAKRIKALEKIIEGAQLS